jgi:NAD(P)-dependent dehydrogenase (short-subunit alcohol dehydrogenase family)
MVAAEALYGRSSSRERLVPRLNPSAEEATVSRLQNKVAVITGGTSGIGLAAAQRFVAEGAFVYIFGRRQKELDKTVASIGRNVAGVQGDVRKFEDLDRLYAKVASDGRKIDVVVANVGTVNSVKLADVLPRSQRLRRLQDRTALLCQDLDDGAQGPRHPGQHDHSGSLRHAAD